MPATASCRSAHLERISSGQPNGPVSPHRAAASVDRSSRRNWYADGHESPLVANARMAHLAAPSAAPTLNDAPGDCRARGLPASDFSRSTSTPPWNPELGLEHADLSRLDLLPWRPGGRVFLVCGDAPVKFFRLAGAECGRMGFNVFPKRVQQLKFLSCGKALMLFGSVAIPSGENPGARCQMVSPGASGKILGARGRCPVVFPGILHRTPIGTSLALCGSGKKCKNCCGARVLLLPCGFPTLHARWEHAPAAPVPSARFPSESAGLRMPVVAPDARA